MAQHGLILSFQLVPKFGLLSSPCPNKCLPSVFYWIMFLVFIVIDQTTMSWLNNDDAHRYIIIFLDCSPVLGIDVIPVTKHTFAAPFHMHRWIWFTCTQKVAPCVGGRCDKSISHWLSVVTCIMVIIIKFLVVMFIACHYCYSIYAH